MSKPLSLKDFFADRFNSDPYALLDWFNPEISNIASEAFVDWNSIASSIQLNDKKHRGKIGMLPGGQKGKVAVFGQVKESLNGIEFPHINFTSKQNGGYTVTFDGYQALKDLYERDGALHVTNKKTDWQKAQEVKRAERQARAAASEAKANKERERRQHEHNAYELAFKRETKATFPRFKQGRLIESAVEFLDVEDGSFEYLEKKLISEIAGAITLKRMKDEDGEFVALELTDIDGNYKGLQRLYKNFKKYTVAVEDGQFDGAHCVIGSLDPSGKAFGVEGFATGATVFMATEKPVIVAMNADNLKKTYKQYARVFPDLAIVNAADNDAWKPVAGNKGLMTAIEVHKEFNIRSTYPRWENMPQEVLDTKPTDWNDLHVIGGLKSVSNMIKSNDSRLKSESKYFDYCLQRLAYVGHQTATEEALRAVAAGMMLFPIVHNRKEIVELILNALPKGCPCDLYKIKSRMVWLARGKAHRARELRSFTLKELNKAHINYMRMKAMMGQHGNMILPAEIVDMIRGLEGMVIVRAPMGYGKTEHLIKPLLEESERGAYIAHRVSLIGDASQRLGIANYQELLAYEVPYVDHIACCVNSIVNPKFQNADGLSWFETIDTLCIDEASQVARHITGGPVDNPTKVMDRLISAMRTSKRVVLCDADANDSLIQLCEMARPGEKIHVIEVEGTCDDIEVLHTDVNTAFNRAVDMAADGKKLLVADDGAKDGEKLVISMLEKNPALKILQVSKEQKTNFEVDQFLSNPNKYCVDYDVVIYSPAISSGVSITAPHFDAHVSIFHAMVTPSDAIQMMRRDRTAKKYILGIGINTTQRETDREAIFRGLMSADEFASADFIETEEEISFRHKKTIFDEMYLTCQANENMARNDFANNLLLMLGIDGYIVKRLDANSLEKTMGQERKKSAGEVVNKRRINMVLSQETPSDELYQRLSRSDERSVEESAQIDRHNMENQLCVDQIDEDVIKFYDDQGIKKVLRLELVKSTDEQASAYDHMQFKNKVVMTRHSYKRATRALTLNVFDGLGVNIETGEGSFNVQQCKEVMRELLRDKASIEMYNALKIGAYVNPKSLPKDPTTFVKNILSKVGLEVRKRKTRGKNVFSISEESWARVSYFLAKRAQKGVHGLKFELPSDIVLENSKNHPQAAPAAALQGGILAQGGIESDVNYPSDKKPDAAKIKQIVTEAITDTSITFEMAMGWLGKTDLEDIERGELTAQQLSYYFRIRNGKMTG